MLTFACSGTSLQSAPEAGVEGSPMCDTPINDKDEQIETMREWFYENFEDPVHRTPYESREGGYQWIWGGPYDAGEELSENFSGGMSDEAIEELAEELNSECPEWAPVESVDDYDDYFLEVIATIEDCNKEFTSAISDVKCLLSTDIPAEAVNKFHCLLFVNVITALEAYLSDKFIKRVMMDDAVLRKFVESTPDFGNEKISLSEVLKVSETIHLKVRSHLSDIVWHNLGRIKPMYKATLDADLGDIGPLMLAVTKRHHIVHRNGQDKDGNSIDITEKDVNDIISLSEGLVESIEKQLTEPF